MTNITMNFKAIKEAEKEIEELSSELSDAADKLEYLDPELDRLEIITNSAPSKKYENRIQTLLEELTNDNPGFTFVKGTEEHDTTTCFISFIDNYGFDATWWSNVINGTKVGMNVGLDGYVDDLTLEAIENLSKKRQ